MTFKLKILSQRSMEFNDLLDLKQNLHFYYLLEVFCLKNINYIVLEISGI